MQEPLVGSALCRVLSGEQRGCTLLESGSWPCRWASQVRYTRGRSQDSKWHGGQVTPRGRRRGKPTANSLYNKISVKEMKCTPSRGILKCLLIHISLSAVADFLFHSLLFVCQIGQFLLSYSRSFLPWLCWNNQRYSSFLSKCLRFHIKVI